MGRRNPLSEYTHPELEYFRQECNFTPDELAVFNLWSRDWSMVHIGMELSMSESTVKRRRSDIKRKLNRVL